ncbi:16S rRNA (uracil(1498)-N(3))-methyltransferase [Brevibacillus fulvus]|uniref:Ribosomal RNA small subunit methyltransferase E n=1 Tax=Brevibacillus fulvus TaxID=1125967 RepID=A0A939BP04_9BACL|nr:16S rRNA (uracil(1498)-N(3))-methyltransferase [Brevibacillus fulvus]MBM7589875.1 16S rRNA (uracil1498-N3)-methyltransferase [Brevibacillus fulvus]
MQRYFVEPHQISDREVTITGDDVHHIVNVMRLKPGEQIIVCDGRGRSCLARLRQSSANAVQAQIETWLDEQKELPVQITIGQGLPKGDKMEWILQKGTELGAFAFFPFSSERTIVKLEPKKEAKKLERWTKIVKEAAEQSHRSVLPQIRGQLSFKQALETGAQYTRCVIAYEKEEQAKLREVLDTLVPGDSLLVLIGPEGGFTEQEVEWAESKGFQAVTFGPRILRTETASQYLLSAASYHFER